MQMINPLKTQHPKKIWGGGYLTRASGAPVYELVSVKLTCYFFLISFVKLVQTDVQYDVMLDAE